MFNAIKGHGGTVKFILLPYESHGYAAKKIFFICYMSNMHGGEIRKECR
jgi:hypothetical protein